MDTDHFILRRIKPELRPFVVIAAGITLQFTYGIVYTFGNLLPYLVSYLRWKVNPTQSQGSLIWLQSLIAGLPCAMLTGGFVEKKLGGRMGILMGTTLYTGFLAVSYLTIQHSFPMLLISLGLFSSFGQGVSYNCVLIISQRWFPNNVGLASGLITAGYGMSAFLISPLQTRFINPNNLPVNKDGFFTQVELLERVPKMFLLLAGIFALLQFVAILFIGEPKKNTVTTESREEANEPMLNESANSRTTPALSHKEVIFSDTFVFLFLTLLLNSVWVQTISGLYKAFGQTFIVNDFFLATVNSLAAGCNCLSRVFWGHFADKTSYETTMSIACAVGAALMWTLGVVKLVDNQMLFMLWICLMFFCIGATYCLVPYAAHRCFGAENFGIAYGFIQVSMTFAGIITALCSQFLLSMVGFNVLFTIMASTTFISFLLTLAIRRTKYGKSVAPE
ncbi:major facilitator superfamily domain-containing protein [Ditylenchus destructor]|nr:major facilitator superfamily domain-containing protein [Ditylenchus destructor]